MLSDKRTFDERPSNAELQQGEVDGTRENAKDAISRLAAACGVWKDGAEDIASEAMGWIEEAIREANDE